MTSLSLHSRNFVSFTLFFGILLWHSSLQVAIWQENYMGIMCPLLHSGSYMNYALNVIRITLYDQHLHWLLNLSIKQSKVLQKSRCNYPQILHFFKLKKHKLLFLLYTCNSYNDTADCIHAISKNDTMCKNCKSISLLLSLSTNTMERKKL